MTATVTEQYELAAWEHELRDARGRWTSGDLWASHEGEVPDISPAESAAARRTWFGGLSYAMTNNYLRNGKKPSEVFGGGAPDNDASYLADVATLQALMKRAPPLARDATFYRGTKGTSRIFGPPGSMVGKTFRDPGIMSASADPHVISQFEGTSKFAPDRGRLVIQVPRGGTAFKAAGQLYPAGEADAQRLKEYTFAGQHFTVVSDQVVPDELGSHREITVRQQVGT